MSEFLSKYVVGLLSILLKKQNVIVFFIDKDQAWGGNLRAYFEYVYEKNSFKLVVLNRGICSSQDIAKKYPRAIVSETVDFSVLRFALRAKFFIITHGKKPLRGLLHGIKGYKLVNLWHGIPIKAVGNLQASYQGRTRKLDNTYNKSKSFDLVCCSSMTDRAIMAACHLLHGDRLVVSGIPKTDWLMCSEQKLPKDYQNDLEKLENQLAGRKLVFYTPTGRDNKEEDYFFESDEMIELVDALSERNCVLGFRYHGLPLQNQFRKKHHAIIEQGKILDFGLDIYSESNIILRKTALLICDYSSILVDYLLMNKPIVRFAYDLDDYVKNRGLLYNYEKVLPGRIVKDVDSLSSVINEMLHDEIDSEYPQKWLFHQYEDAFACQRIYERMLSMS